MSWREWWDRVLVGNAEEAIYQNRLERERSVTRDILDLAYAERNQVVAALAKLFPSGTARTAIDGWDPAWHGCVYIDLPTGQVSWHYHEREAHWFEALPPYTKPWDGHDTPEKYRRLAALTSQTNTEKQTGNLEP